jgi:hypothetical protein
VNWKRDAEKASGFQARVNNLVWHNGYTQVVSGPTGGDALLDICLLRPERSLISCNSLPRINDHNGVLLEVEWDEICPERKVKKIVPVYHKTDVLCLQAFLWENFKLRAGNGSCVEHIWKSYKDIIFEGVERYIPQKILSKDLDPEYCNKEIKRLMVKGREMYNKRTFGQPYQQELKRLSKELLVAKKKAQETFFHSVLQSGREMYNKRTFGQPYQQELKRLSKELLVAKKKAQETFFSFSLTKRRQMLKGVLQVRG